MSDETNLNNGEILGDETATPKVKDKAGDFVRISVRRVSAVLNQINLIGKLSNKSSYEYTDKQIAEIRKATDIAQNEFTGKNETKKVFSFSNEEVS